MKALYIFIGFTLCICSPAFTQCLNSIDYNSWNAIGDDDANWTVAGDGLSVTQSVNTGASAFMSNDTLFNVKISGTFRSNDSDDDWMGFIMGYRGATPYQSYLFTWKQKQQGAAPEGFSYWDLTDRLAPINYNTTSPPNSILLDSSYGVGKGWVRNFDHNFEMYYQSTESIILIDGDTIFKNKNCYNPGRFGFYNNSQEACIYSNFNFEILADFFIEKDTICLGEVAQLDIFCDVIVDNYYDSVVWDFGDGSPLDISTNNHSISHTYTNAGTYAIQLLVKHKKTGCIAITTKTITVENQFQATLGNDTILCPGENDLLSLTTSLGNTITNYTWSTGDSTPTITVDSAALYSVEVINQYGCIDRDTLLLTIQSPFTVSYATTNVSCYGQSSGSLTITAPLGNFDYQIDANSYTSNPTIASLTANTYSLTVRDSVGCTQDTTFTISEPQELVLNVVSTKDERCFDLCDGSAVFSQTGGVAPFSTFITGNQFNDTATALLCDGTYKAFITDSNLCVDSVDFIINGPSPVLIGTNEDSICIGGPQNISALASGGSLLGGSDYTYYWNTAGTVQGQTLANEYPFSDTTYTVYALDDSLCSSDTIDIRIYVNPVIDFTASITEACPPFTSFFSSTLTNNVTLVTCSWTYGNDSISDNCNNTQTTYAIPGFYDVTYAVSTDKGCYTEVTKTNYIEVYEPPIADFTYTPFPENASVLNPTYSFTNTSSNGAFYAWNAAGLDSSNDANPSFTFSELEEKTYPITLITTSMDGCSDTITQSVIIENKVFIYIPNSFSPNGDGINDVFKPILNGLELESYVFSVYNRWGELIFSTNLQNHKGWDGTNQGNVLDDGTYVWRLTGSTRLTYGSTLEDVIKKEGTVTIIK